MSITASQAAQRICEIGDWKVTNLRIQKVLYYAHMIYLGENDRKPLIDESFEAWKYGPVIPSLFWMISDSKENPPSQNVFRSVKHIDDNSPEAKQIRGACELTSEISTWNLVKSTHQEGGAWKITQDHKKTNFFSPRKIISNDEIFNEFQRLIQSD